MPTRTPAAHSTHEDLRAQVAATLTALAIVVSLAAAYAIGFAVAEQLHDTTCSDTAKN